MPRIDSHSPGTPCWFELGTTDQQAAKTFYAGLLGWTSNDYPMGPGELYTIFQLEGRDTGGGYTLSEQMKEQGVPPHWLVYFVTTDVDASVVKATSLGGKVVVAPFDVTTFGRMAVLQDPTTATFALWQPRDSKGVGITGQPGTVCWSEVNTRDPKAAADFYTALLGAEAITEDHLMGVYTFLAVDGKRFGGIMTMTAEWGDVPPHWMIYFQVADCDAAAAHVKANGGKVAHGPFDAPGVGRIAICMDPQGAAFSIIKLASAG